MKLTAITFIARRLVFAVVLLLVVTLLVYSLLSLSGVSPIARIIGGETLSEEQLEALRAKNHLDDPFIVQYGYWLIDALQLDFGRSIGSNQTVTSMIAERLPITLGLAGISLFIVVIVGVPAGVIAGTRRGTWVDRLVSSMTTLGLSAPTFALGIVLLYVFGVTLAWFPVYGPGSEGLADRVWHLVLPSFALSLSLTAIVARQTRAAMLNISEQDFVTFAKARGLRRRRIIVHYLLRNAALPVITVTGLLVITLVGGTVLIEQVFSLDGVGQLMLRSVRTADIAVVQGITVFIALAVVLTNLIVDLVTMLVDPRTRYATKG